MRQPSPRHAAARATARPSLPALAAHSRRTSGRARVISTAQEAPRILNAGSPKRSDSELQEPAVGQLHERRGPVAPAAPGGSAAPPRPRAPGLAPAGADGSPGSAARSPGDSAATPVSTRVQAMVCGCAPLLHGMGSLAAGTEEHGGDARCCDEGRVGPVARADDRRGAAQHLGGGVAHDPHDRGVARDLQRLAHQQRVALHHRAGSSARQAASSSAISPSTLSPVSPGSVRRSSPILQRSG